MKRILITLALFVTSCSDDVTLSKEEYNKLKGIKTLEYPKPFYFDDEYLMYWDWHISLGADGHEYLYNQGGNSTSLVVTHNSDCKKCLHKDSIRDAKIDSIINLINKQK